MCDERNNMGQQLDITIKHLWILFVFCQMDPFVVLRADIARL